MHGSGSSRRLGCRDAKSRLASVRHGFTWCQYTESLWWPMVPNALSSSSTLPQQCPLVLRQQLGQMSMEIHVLAHSTKIGSIFDLSSPQFDLVFRSNTTEICPVIRDLFESPPKSATIAKTLVAGGLATVSFSPCCRTVAMGCN